MILKAPFDYMGFLAVFMVLERLFQNAFVCRVLLIFVDSMESMESMDSMESMESMESMNSMESMEFHGFHGIPWIPWNSMDSAWELVPDTSSCFAKT